MRHCDGCRELVDALRADREELRRSADDMPGNVTRLGSACRGDEGDYSRGLAAGECVTPRERKAPAISWRPAAIAAGLMVVLAAAWWLNIPRSDTEVIGRALHTIATGAPASTPRDERGPVVGASSSGVELLENGGGLGIDQSGLEPVMFSVSTQGSASARYVDHTGQVTITATYVQ